MIKRPYLACLSLRLAFNQEFGIGQICLIALYTCHVNGSVSILSIRRVILYIITQPFISSLTALHSIRGIMFQM